MTINLEEQLREVGSRQELADFVDKMRLDLDNNPENWSHLTLAGFLDSLSGSVAVLDRIYANLGMELGEDVPWSIFAQILMAARVRE